MLMQKSELVSTKTTREWYLFWRWSGPILTVGVTTWAGAVRDPTSFAFPNWTLGGIIAGLMIGSGILRVVERKACGLKNMSHMYQRLGSDGISSELQADDRVFSPKDGGVDL